MFITDADQQAGNFKDGAKAIGYTLDLTTEGT